jgi:hypothetical protein
MCASTAKEEVGRPQAASPPRTDGWRQASRCALTGSRRGFVALATDASLGATVTSLGRKGDRVQIWELATDRLRSARTFGDGIENLPLVTQRVALVSVRIPKSPFGGISSIPPPAARSLFWDFASDQLREARWFDLAYHGPLVSSRQGDRMAYETLNGVMMGDLAHPELGAGRTLAPEWQPPATPHPEPSDSYPHKPQPHIDVWASTAAVVFVAGGVLLVAYRRLLGLRECRLERWTPDTSHATGGPVTRLLTAHGECWFGLLAASDDGRLVVMNGVDSSLLVRRAPKYVAEPLAADSATCAAVLGGGARIVTGHTDGHLRLWNAETLALLAQWP